MHLYVFGNLHREPHKGFFIMINWQQTFDTSLNFYLAPFRERFEGTLVFLCKRNWCQVNYISVCGCL